MNRRHWMQLGAAGLGTLLGLHPAITRAITLAAGPGSPFIEELTWTELRDRVAAGSTTLLVPVGGTEQSGPHMVLGKHNVRVHALAGQIAQALGNALVAPVIAHVPEGQLRPPTSHMRYPGTISIPDATFESLLEATARSFALHGFRRIVFLGDHGGYQANLERVAARLEREWQHQPRAAGAPDAHAHALTEYYRATQTAFVAELERQGYSRGQIGIHAGLADTALSLAIDPALVRQDQLAHTAPDAAGVTGDPRPATAALGRAGVRAVVEASVAAIRRLTQ